VHVYFEVDYSEGEPVMRYRFENESLVHQGRTIRPRQFEGWLERLLKDKMQVRKLMDLNTRFERSRIVLPPEVDEDAFYEGCALLDSTLGSISYDDEIDQSTRDIYSALLRISEENNLSKGASVSKIKLTRISTFNAIAQVLGKAEESPGKKGAEKTHEQKLAEFYALYPHIREAEAKLGAFQYTPERNFFFGKGETGEIVKFPVDESFKRTKKDAQILQKDDGSGAEYIYKGEHNKKNGTKDGKGVFVWPEGAKYEGLLHEDHANGFGRMIHRHGDVYEGEWFNDKAYGQGVYYHSNGVKYTGEWESDLPNGSGVEEWPDGSRYEGKFKAGIKEGQGRFFWSNGNVYSGEWRDNVMWGLGVYEWADGKRYEGHWAQGKLWGKGVFTWKDGRKYDGDYETDQKHGYGEYSWPDGRVYRGPWKSGRQHGEGLYRSAEGSEKRGLWSEGQRLKWFKEDKKERRESDIGK